MSKGIIVTINDEERKKKFIEIFGDNKVYVTSPLAIPIKVKDGVFTAYFLDLSLVTKKQRKRLIDSICKDFNQDRDYVEKNLDLIGVPINSNNTSMVCTDSGAFYSAFLDDMGLEPNDFGDCDNREDDDLEEF